MYYYIIGSYMILKIYQYMGIVETLYTAGKGVKYIVDCVTPFATHRKQKTEKTEKIEELDWILIQN